MLTYNFIRWDGTLFHPWKQVGAVSKWVVRTGPMFKIFLELKNVQNFSQSLNSSWKNLNLLTYTFWALSGPKYPSPEASYFLSCLEGPNTLTSVVDTQKCKCKEVR